MTRIPPESPGSRRVASAAQMQALDRLAIEDRGVPSLVLMENASRAAADHALELCDTGPVLVLCGPGNNGGDGLALARTLWNRGREVQVVRVGGPFDRPERDWPGGDYPGGSGADVQVQLRLLPEPLLEGSIDVRDRVSDELKARLASCGLVVDALFGIGLTRPVEGCHARVLEAAARSTGRVLAIDLPSGLHADTGAALGPCLACDATTTFAAWKHGLRRGAGPRLAGEVRVAEIGIPRDLLETLELLDAAPPGSS
ncbi:MAG: NAD(P)H-hydrate epimerase [Planctomycetota bacterium]